MGLMSWWREQCSGLVIRAKTCGRVEVLRGVEYEEGLGEMNCVDGVGIWVKGWGGEETELVCRDYLNTRRK